MSREIHPTEQINSATLHKYDVLLESISTGIIGIGNDGLIGFCSPGAQRRIGGDVSLEGLRLTAIFASGDPNHGVTWDTSFFPEMILSQEKMFVKSGKLLGSNGGDFNASYSFVPLSSEYKAEGGLLIFTVALEQRHDVNMAARSPRCDKLTGLPNEAMLRETLQQMHLNRLESKKLLNELLDRLRRNKGPKP